METDRPRKQQAYKASTLEQVRQKFNSHLSHFNLHQTNTSQIIGEMNWRDRNSNAYLIAIN